MVGFIIALAIVGQAPATADPNAPVQAAPVNPAPQQPADPGQAPQGMPALEGPRPPEGPIDPQVLMGPQAPVATQVPIVRYPAAIETAYFTFPRRTDRDFRTPDDWLRIIRPGYPSFVTAELTSDTAAEGTRSLAVRMNGGNFAYFSPAIPASYDFNYVLQAKIRTKGLIFDSAAVLLEFLDENKQLIGRQHVSPRVGGTRDWTSVTVGPVASTDPKVKFLRIACLTQHGEQMDLAGSAYFDDLWVGRLPRYFLKSTRPHQVFEVDSPKGMQLTVTGIEQRKLTANMALSDVAKLPIADQSFDLSTSPEGKFETTWTLPVGTDQVGFFNLQLSIQEKGQEILGGYFPITILEPGERVAGEFGLALPAPAHGLDHYERIVSFSGSRWVKLPLWAGAADLPEFRPGTRDFRRFIRFGETLRLNGHQIVGGLERAPREIENNLPGRIFGMADVFSLPTEKWTVSLQEVVAAYGTMVRHWQIGSDSDTSFETVDNLDTMLTNINEQMSLVGQDIDLGIAWSWFRPTPDSKALSFISMTSSPMSFSNTDTSKGSEWTPLSAETLLQFLRHDEKRPGIRDFWVQVPPLPQNEYDLTTRAADLVMRMVAAKVGGATGIMATQIDAPERGFFDRTGAPLELYTVWRTIALHLGGTQSIGQLYLPGKIPNEVFVRTGGGTESAVVVCWNSQPVEAELIVGPHVLLTDVWGRQTPLDSHLFTKRIPIGPIPILIEKANAGVLRLQIETHFARGKLSGAIGRTSDRILIKCPFPNGMFGTVRPHFPPDWRPSPREFTMQVRNGETFSGEMLFDIPATAIHGKHEIPIDFDITADEHYVFRMVLPYQLGGDELRIEPITRLLPNGELEVEVSLINLLDRPMQLRCSLRAFQHQVQQLRLDLNGQETQVLRYFLNDGANLIGDRIRLEVTEIGGSRQFNIEFNAVP